MRNLLHELTNLPREERIAKGIEHTPGEIERQPRVWIKNFERLKKREDEIRDFIELSVFSKKMPRVILSGAGSSGFIGLAVENVLRKRWQIDVETKASTDIVTNWDSIFLKSADTTLISFARSGNSPESIGSVVLANSFCERVAHIVITCNKNGRLAKTMNDHTLLLLLEEAYDKGLAMTASFTTMLIAAQFLAYIRDIGKYERIIRDLSRATENLFERYSGFIKEVSELDFERTFFLGNGALYGCAVESQLKLQELTVGRIVCKSDSFLGIRHGPEAAVNNKTLLVYLVSSDPFVRRYELDLMKELHAKALGLKRIAVCNKSCEEMTRYVDDVIEFDPNNEYEIPDLCRPVIDVTVGQILALFKSLNLSLKPDNPSEKGIITRVVKGVKIYDHEKFKQKKKFETLTE